MKYAFVTGASRGIGREIALRFAKEGYFVGFSYCHSEEEARSLLLEISAYSAGLSFRCDFADQKSLDRLCLEIQSKMPVIDVLVNNAGVSSYGLFQDVDEAEFDRVFSVNFKSTFFLTKALVSSMISRKEGCVINVSSIWGQTGASCEVLYSATKSAVIGFTKALAKELALSGIRVNCIAPGVVDTDMMKAFSEEEKRAIADEIPMGCFTSAGEIADLSLFLAENAPTVTGQVFAVNGGMYC